MDNLGLDIYIEVWLQLSFIDRAIILLKAQYKSRSRELLAFAGLA